MQFTYSSTLLLTILLGIGLGFFLRAASKDRTTVVEVHSPQSPLKVLEGLSNWLELRGWKRDGGDLNRQVLRFRGSVASSKVLFVFLSLLGALGSASLGLVLRQLYPVLDWWPLLLAVLGGPISGLVYRARASRDEELELRLISSPDSEGSVLRLKAHRDELIAIELELAKSLELASDGSLLSSPV